MSFFKPEQAQPVVAQTQPLPTKNDPAVEEARRLALLQSRFAGRRATLLTSGQGVTGTAPTAPRRLLSGAA